MKIKKLESIINPTSPKIADDEGIGDKIAGFAMFASPKKGNKDATVDINGFAQVKKNKDVFAQVNKNKDVFAQSMIEAKQDIGVNVGGDKSTKNAGFTDIVSASDRRKCLVKNTKKRSRPAIASASTEKAGFTDKAKMRKFRSPTENIRAKPASAGDEDGYAPISQAKMRKFRSPTESIPAKSAERVPTKPGQHNSTQSVERISTKPASVGDEDGYAPIIQAKMRRFRSPNESIPPKSAERVPTNPGQQNSTQSAEHVPTKPGHQNSTQSGQRIPAQSEHQNGN